MKVLVHCLKEEISSRYRMDEYFQWGDATGHKDRRTVHLFKVEPMKRLASFQPYPQIEVILTDGGETDISAFARGKSYILTLEEVKEQKP